MCTVLHGFFFQILVQLLTTHLVQPEANLDPQSIRIPPISASGTLTPFTLPIDDDSPADKTAPPVTPITKNTCNIVRLLSIKM